MGNVPLSKSRPMKFKLPKKSTQSERSHGEPSENEEEKEDIELHNVKSGEMPLPKAVNNILLINDAENPVSNNPKTTKGSKLDLNEKNIYGFKNRGPQKYWVLRLLYSSRRSEDIPPEERGLFLVKSYFLLIICLAVTTYITWHAYETQSFQKHFDLKSNNSKYLVYSSIAAYICILLALMFSQCTTIEPGNLIVAVLSVMSFSVFMILLIIKFNKKELLYVLMATSIVVFCCLLLATTEFNFTKWYVYLVVLGLVVFVSVIIFVVAMEKFGEKYSKTRLTVAFFATLYYCICITVQMQLILLGKSIEMDESHFIVAAVLLYMSVATVFLEAARFVMAYIQDDIRWR